jgi:glucokinase
MSKLSFCADFGGTSIKLGVLDGDRIEQSEIDAEAQKGLRPKLGQIESEWRRLAAMLGESGPPNLIGLGLPSVIEPWGNRILSGFNKYTDAGEIDLEEWATSTFGAPLLIENDAHSALAGEWTSGAAKGHDNAIFLGFGTGIGTSVISDGIPQRGPHGQAGNLGGHLQINAGGRKCMCGGVGCAEAEASGWSLPGLAEESRLIENSSIVRPVTAGNIFRAAAAGDALAMQLRERSVDVWAALTASMIHAHDPEVVVISGGIMRADGLFEQFRERALGQIWRGAVPPLVRKGALGSKAALIGLQRLAEIRQSRG